MTSPTPINDYRTLPGPSRPRAPSRNISRSSQGSQQQQPAFQPRIVRGTVTSPGTPSSQYSNGGGSTRSPRTRRASTATVNSSNSTSGAVPSLALALPYGVGSIGAPAMHQRKLSLPAPSSLSSDHARSPYGAYDSPISFPLPAYLEHSAFRRFLQITPYVPSPPHSHHHHPDVPERHRDRPHQLRANPRSNSGAVVRRRLLQDSDDDSSSDGERRSPSYRSGTVHWPGASATGSPSASTAAAAINGLDDDEIIQLPTRWNRDDRSPSLNISADGREVHFNGVPVAADKEAAAVRTNCPMPRVCGIYYYEVEIIDKGAKGHIGIGFGTSRVSLTRLPGWAQPGWQPEWAHESWGYHGDDGRSFASQDTGSPYGQKFSTGDTIGCGVDFTLKRAFYTKNGAFQGYVFEDVDGELYPMVGLRTQGETIRSNFGHAPFKFDIESHVHQRRNAIWAKIQSTPVAWSVSNPSFGISREKDAPTTDPSSSTLPSAIAVVSNNAVSNVMDQIVLDYLNHHGYAGTARALRARMDSKSASGPSLISPPPTGSDGNTISTANMILSDTIIRQQIMSAILSGDVDFALAVTRANYSAALDAHGGWMFFRLRCRKFVELLLEAAAALKIARKIEAATSSDAQKTIVPSHSPDETDMYTDLSVHGVISDDEGEEDVDVEEDVDSDAMEVDEVAQALVGSPSSSPANPSAFSASLELSSPISGKQQHFQSQKQWEKQPARAQPYSSSPLAPSRMAAQIALENALQYGRILNADYEHDERPHVQSLFRRTSSLVAYENPLEKGGDVSRLAGQTAREELATELNEAILASQGRYPQPMLERLVAHTTSVVVELGLRGNGAVAFADVEKEFLRG